MDDGRLLYRRIEEVEEYKYLGISIEGGKHGGLKAWEIE